MKTWMKLLKQSNNEANNWSLCPIKLNQRTMDILVGLSWVLECCLSSKVLNQTRRQESALEVQIGFYYTISDFMCYWRLNVDEFHVTNANCSVFFVCRTEYRYSYRSLEFIVPLALDFRVYRSTLLHDLQDEQQQVFRYTGRDWL